MGSSGSEERTGPLLFRFTDPVLLPGMEKEGGESGSGDGERKEFWLDTILE